MDEQLRQSIEAICQHPEGSRERRKALHRFLLQLQQLPGILKSSHPDYLDALNQTWEWISRNICSTFELRSASWQDSLVKWINGYLYWRIKDLYMAKAVPLLSLDKAIGDESDAFSLLEKLSETGFQTPTLSGLEGYIERLQQEENYQLEMKLKHYIRHDPEHRLRNCHPRDCLACTCQFLCQKRYLQDPPDSFETIAQLLNLKLSQVTNHWYGRCKPLLQTIAKELGYGVEQP